MKRTIAIGAAALILSCGSSKTNDPPKQIIKLGAVLDQTGTNAAPSWGEAAKLAVADANAGLAKAGKPIAFEMTVEDSVNTPATAVQRANDLVRTYGAKGLVLDSSGDDVAVNKLAYDSDPGNDLNVPLICMICTSPSINNPNATGADDATTGAYRNAQQWNFRAIMNTDLIAKVLVKIALATNNGDANGDGTFKISVYGVNDTAGQGFANSVAQIAAELHPNPPPIVEKVFIPTTADANSYDFNSDIQKLTDNRNENTQLVDGYPDYLMEVTFASFVIGIVQAYQNTNQTVRFLHGHSLRLPKVALALGSAVNGQEGASHALLDDGASGTVFAQDFQAAQGTGPVYLDSNAYDAANALILASLVASKGMPDASQVTGAQIRDAMKTINDKSGTVIRTGPDEIAKAMALIDEGKPINYEGASGPMDFDVNQNVLDRLAHFKGIGGQLVDQEKYDCVSGSDCPQTP